MGESCTRRGVQADPGCSPTATLQPPFSYGPEKGQGSSQTPLLHPQLLDLQPPPKGHRRAGAPLIPTLLHGARRAINTCCSTHSTSSPLTLAPVGLFLLAFYITFGLTVPARHPQCCWQTRSALRWAAACQLCEQKTDFEKPQTKLGPLRWRNLSNWKRSIGIWAAETYYNHLFSLRRSGCTHTGTHT